MRYQREPHPDQPSRADLAEEAYLDSLDEARTAWQDQPGPGALTPEQEARTGRDPWAAPELDGPTTPASGPTPHHTTDRRPT